MQKAAIGIALLLFTGLLNAQESHTCQQLKQLMNLHKAAANNSRSDSIDVLHYTVNLDITDFTNKVIKGSCAVQFTPKVNGITHLPLDLLQLTVDSVKENSTALTYLHDDTLLLVTLPSTMNVGDTSTIEVFYQGQPAQDNSGWGGWYWQGGYSFNLGVGFEAIPHNYGRVWHPCFDNFVERATYDFNITTSGGKLAACNGSLIDTTTIVGDTLLSQWQLQDEIPSYLACIAVGPYERVQWTHNAISGPIPMVYYAAAFDTTDMKNSFTNIGSAIDTYEDFYGPHQWNKIGYSLVPFNSGAMEHATNIAYPLATIDGSTTYETLMAHELAHHWWGDLATCHQAEEMWINEGMASYSEYLFQDQLYGWDTYIQGIIENHAHVVRFPQHREGGYHALNNVPLEHTYGDHSYKKGADVAHTLRGYLGDSLFKVGLSGFLAANQFVDVTSEELRDQLSTITGYDLTDFFDGWVLNPGFPHFYIDSFKVTGTGPYNVEVFIHQKLTGAPNYFSNVPMEITFMSNNWQEHTEKLMLSGEYSTHTISIPFSPTYATLNKNNLISHAVTDNQKIVNGAGTYSYAEGLMTLTVNSINDSAYIRVEHNYAKPDPIIDLQNKKYDISPNRWWRVGGIVNGNYDIEAVVFYDGRETTSGNGGWLDNYLVGTTEDSLLLLYREDPSKDWEEHHDYTLNVLGNSLNAFGKIDIHDLKLGEYALANHKYNVGQEETAAAKEKVVAKVFPNPGEGSFQFKLSGIDASSGYVLRVSDLQGKQVRSVNVKSNSFVLQLDALPAGTYVWDLIQEYQQVATGKLVLKEQ